MSKTNVSFDEIQTIWRERRKARAPLVLKPQNIPVYPLVGINR